MIQALTAIQGQGSSLATLDGLSNMAGPSAMRPNVGVENTFQAALATAAGNAVDTLHGAEGVSLKALQGEADTREVVDAVMSAEQTLQAAIAIRDKIINSYLEVSRMQI
ncbi:flagellar hook-basal body complex protein FliE [Mesorhizobium sp. CAU 1741]|uniref:flagellar hook-basal body complex protein FliE n=1 Tax=Mesorhizobium sp. CAU 1741 TaxID=3140366 RepID=UPI00325BDC00